MKDNCLTISVRRRKAVLMDGTELSPEMMWGGENLKRYTQKKSPDAVFLLHSGIGF